MVDSCDFGKYCYNAQVLAQKFIEWYFDGQAPAYPLDPFEMLDKLGVAFEFRDFKKLEGIYIAPENDMDIPVVGINQNRPITRQRFTAAHELCHHIKDKQNGNNISCMINSQTQIEKFAEDFAARLLMPTEELKKQVAKYEKDGVVTLNDVIQIADYFGASFSSCTYAIAYRLKKLEGETAYPKLKKRIEKFKPKQMADTAILHNDDISLFRRSLEHVYKYFLPNENLAIWYKFKNKFVYNENKLEGVEVDIETVSEILADLRVSGEKSEFRTEKYSSIIEVAGHSLMFDYIMQPDNVPTTIFNILTLNAMLYKYAPFPETGGKLRDSNNYVAGAQFETVDYSDIPQELCKLDVSLKELLRHKNELSLGDYIDQAVKIHYALTIIHPFADGNGRTSRVLLNWLFRIKLLPPVYLKSQMKEEYYEALHDADVNHNLNKLNGIFYKAIISSFVKFTEYPDL